MKAFWWFEDKTVAGMARPGFNNIHWFDLPFDEALVFGWVGQRSSAVYQTETLHQHIREYGEKIRHYHKVDASAFANLCERLSDPPSLVKVLEQVALKTNTIQHCELKDEQIALTLNAERLNSEVAFLKQQGIRSVVSLTENHHQKEELEKHFELHHLAIDDLTPPKFEQVQALAELIQESRTEKKPLVVHCMAGIGRTSTMLMAAHLALGENLEDLKVLLKRQNPHFAFSGSQSEFIHAVAEKVKSDRK
jgi:atypical dual specificity phosphatase